MTAGRAGRGAIRILAGRWKGRSLDVPACARPTSARARQALFDMLQDRVAGARVLDLFAGSGAVGLEAVSRGAESAVLVDTDGAGLRRSLASLGASDGTVRVLARLAGPAIEELAQIGERFDIVFADPPYGMAPAQAGLQDAARVLAPEGVFVWQRDAPGETVEIPGLVLASRRDYGRNVFLFYGML